MEIEEAEVGPRLGQEARAHLQTCAPCRKFRDERLALKQLVGSLETATAPSDFEFRLRARLAASQSVNHRRMFRFERAPGMPAIALAAAFALMVTAAVFFKEIKFSGNSPAGPARSIAARSANNEQPPAVAASQSTAAFGSDETARLKNVGMAGPSPAVVKPRNHILRIEKESVERIAAAPEKIGPVNNSVDFSARSAPVISLVAVPGPATNQPVRVSLKDGQGTMRTVSLQPVTFGSQELIERHGKASNVLTSDTRGIW